MKKLTKRAERRRTAVQARDALAAVTGGEDGVIHAQVVVGGGLVPPGGGPIGASGSG